MINFLHLQQPDPFFETALSLGQVAYAQRLQDTVYVYFVGISKPLQLRDQAAEAFWQVVRDHSINIFDPSWDAAPETKSAETISPNGDSTPASE